MPISDRHFIICLGRQVGSGGLTIARHLANVLDCKVYDKELINMAAKESGFAEQFFEKNDEHKGFSIPLPTCICLSHLAVISIAIIFLTRTCTNCRVMSSVRWPTRKIVFS